MNYWWTADYHFSHFNIIRYCERPFKTADPDAPLIFCGHVHQHYKVKRLNEKSLIVNLSVEVWNYYPVSFEEISSAVSAFKRDEKKAIAQGDTKGISGT